MPSSIRFYEFNWYEETRTKSQLDSKLKKNEMISAKYCKLSPGLIWKECVQNKSYRLLLLFITTYQ